MMFLPKKMNQLAVSCYWFIVSICVFIAVVWAAWHVMKSQDFHYASLYDWIEIEQHIDVFGPQNKHFLGLEQLGKTEHVRLFSDIVSAIHHHGVGLTELSFNTSYHTQPLLTKAEVIHLQDVANLIDTLNNASFFCIVVLLVLVLLPVVRGLMFHQPLTFPMFNKHILFTVYSAAIGASLVCVFVIGPTRVFYWFHEVVFPDNHQWFFYYQDSLMTTLMKAPDLFAAMTIGLCIYSIFIAALVFVVFILLNMYSNVVLKVKC
ncbi:DUF1461 domain-containing protein [Shewanella sp. VB17]|uniref:lipoprotein intramolecular transacylase Lit n=1 Tax=Shewanella sp. VB17 TaxID=2739432 RepID=UPI0015664EB8|nr:DUF1461 domain-containing protein [Shewanella sp. VB17]NRD74837.1 DUF1461 domain-containing protein [Shewanella sp. VB17]